MRLREGELLAKVASDRRRPFLIQTDQARLCAYGNRFLVREREGAWRGSAARQCS